MQQEILGCLTQQDWQLLLEGAQKVTYQKGEVIVAEGTTTRAIYILLRGYATIEASSQTQGICLNQVGPGEILGEVSFLEEAGTTASIIADEAVEVQVLSETQIESLLDSVPGLGTRFYKSLAITLAKRLRRSTAKIASLDRAWADATQMQQTLRIGNISERQIPNTLLTELEQFRSALLEVEQQVSNGQGHGVRAQVAVLCDGLFASIAQHLVGDALIDRGWDDLLAFRDTTQLEAGIGDYVFREVFPLLMRSATIACCYARGIHYANDYQLAQRITAQEPDGDSALGVEIDAWFLSRPFCQTYRQSQRFLEARIGAMARSQPGRIRVMSLAAGNARELLNALMAQTQVYGLCLDSNNDALAFMAQQVQALNLTHQTTVLYGRLASLLDGQDQLALPPQQVIYALDLCDRWEEPSVLTLLDWVYARLAPGGRAIFTNLQPNFPDEILLKHVLNWQRCYRTAAEWRELFQQSRGDWQQVEMETQAAPGMLMAMAMKPEE
ncbi:MAG: cyclic nucleotide-binding domain-containing protein [Cyanobacteria bacterium P01_G01_bin.54]